ncbi:hypothetical protein LMH73_002540 [Vibrio splendidus]
MLSYKNQSSVDLYCYKCIIKQTLIVGLIMLPCDVVAQIDLLRDGNIADSLAVFKDYVENGSKHSSDSDVLFPDFLSIDMAKQMRSMMVNTALQEAGMFAPVSFLVATEIMDLFPSAVFIDPIAGRGFIAKALREKGATVIAGDLCSAEPITPVETVDALELVKREKDSADVLLLFWSDMGDDIDLKVAMEWGCTKPIIVMGEPSGCTGSANFADGFFACKHLKGDHEHLTVFVKNSLRVGFYTETDDIDDNSERQVISRCFAKAAKKNDRHDVFKLILDGKSEQEIRDLMGVIVSNREFICDNYLSLSQHKTVESYLSSLSQEDKLMLDEIMLVSGESK